eukprot:COSAG02_NODE_2292_length_9199_cov_45.393956_6_plen_124_part_00
MKNIVHSDTVHYLMHAMGVCVGATTPRLLVHTAVPRARAATGVASATRSRAGIVRSARARAVSRFCILHGYVPVPAVYIFTRVALDSAESSTLALYETILGFPLPVARKLGTRLVTWKARAGE